MKNFLDRFKRTSLDFKLFVLAAGFTGFAGNLFNSVFNNYLNDTFGLSSLQRTFLELPREIPGFLVVFVSAILFFFSARRLAFLAIMLQALGLALLGACSRTLSLMLIWLFINSLGAHIFMPLSSSIGMELASSGKTGRRLGQLSSVANFTAVLGSFFVFVGFKFFHLNFDRTFFIAAFVFILAAISVFFMKKDSPHQPGVHLQFHRSYGLYYWLTILYGTRKQIFLTFAPWVLVTIFNQPTQTLATLLTIGGIAGIAFQPALGKAIDTFGERIILVSEAGVLVLVCLGYGFSRMVFGPTAAFIVTGACYVIDQLLMSVGMARATYLKKIALRPEHVAPTLAMGVTIDHFFSIAIALASGVIWQKLGYQYVFLCGACIAIINFFSAMKIRTDIRGRAHNPLAP